ncbi:MAG TPA: hypothetical protein VM899_05670, partial [Rubellimicrobium sp.]|nr:hypothetical protein [Rubellimicrobium sp.]
ALLIGGGILLLWVCWKMYRELRAGHAAEDDAAAEAPAAGRGTAQPDRHRQEARYRQVERVQVPAGSPDAIAVRDR